MNIHNYSISNIIHTFLIVIFTKKQLFVESKVVPYKIYKQNIPAPHFHHSGYVNTNQMPINIVPNQQNRVLVNSQPVNPVVQYLEPKAYNKIENIKTIYRRPAPTLVSNRPVYTTRNIVPQIPLSQVQSHVVYTTGMPETYIPQKSPPVVYTTQNIVPETYIQQKSPPVVYTTQNIVPETYIQQINPPVRYPETETVIIEETSPAIEGKKTYSRKDPDKRINGIEVNEIHSSGISSSDTIVKKKAKKVKNKRQLEKEIKDIKKEIRDTIDESVIKNEKIKVYKEDDNNNDTDRNKEIEIIEATPVKIIEKPEDEKKIDVHTEIIPEKKFEIVPIISTLIKETPPVTITKTETIQSPYKEVVTVKNSNDVVTPEIRNNNSKTINMSDVYKNRLQAINTINNVNSCTENIEKNIKSISILKSCEQNILNNEIQMNEAILKNKPILNTLNNNILTDPRISDTQLNDIISNNSPSISPLVPIYQYELENSKLITPYYDLNPIINNNNSYEPVVEIQQIHTVYETIRHHKPVHERHIPRTVGYKPENIVIDNRGTKPPKFLDVAKPKRRSIRNYFQKPLFLKDDASREDDRSSQTNIEYNKKKLKNKEEDKPSVEIDKSISRPEKSIQESNKNTELPQTKTITVYESVYKKNAEEENKTDIKNIKTTTLYQMVPNSYKTIKNSDILEDIPTNNYKPDDIPKTVSIDTSEINKSIEKNINHTQYIKNMLGKLKSKQKEGFDDLMDELQDIKTYLNRQLENKVLMIESKINEASYQNKALADRITQNTNNDSQIKSDNIKSKENIVNEQLNDEKTNDTQSSRNQELSHGDDEATMSATNEQSYNKTNEDTRGLSNEQRGSGNIKEIGTKERIPIKDIEEKKKEDLIKNKDLKIIDIAKTDTKSIPPNNESPNIAENLISKNLIASSEKEKEPAIKEDTKIGNKDIIRELNNIKEYISEYQLLKLHLKSFMIEYKSNSRLSDTRITELENLINNVVQKVDELTNKYNNKEVDLKIVTTSDSNSALSPEEKESISEDVENKEDIKIQKDLKPQEPLNVETQNKSEEVKTYIIPKSIVNKTIESNSFPKKDISHKDEDTLTTKNKKIAIVYKNTIDEVNKYEDDHKTISTSDHEIVEKLNEDEQKDNNNIKQTKNHPLIKKVISGKYKKVKNNNNRDSPPVVKNKVKKIIQGKYKKIKKKQVPENFIDSLKKLVF